MENKLKIARICKLALLVRKREKGTHSLFALQFLAFCRKEKNFWGFIDF